MRNVWFIGDTHFGHNNILKYSEETRGHFNGVKEHNEAIVENINKYVKPQDTLWHLGDVAFGVDNLKYIRFINCNNINLVMGNHDTYNIMEYVAVGFNKIVGAIQYKEFLLTHVPVNACQVNERYTCNIHGHLHTYDIQDNRYYNVNADRIMMIPRNLDQIRTDIKLKMRTHKWETNPCKG